MLPNFNLGIRAGHIDSLASATKLRISQRPSILATILLLLGVAQQVSADNECYN